MEIRLPKELSLFFWILVRNVSELWIYLPPPKVAPHCADESRRVVENLRISCALKLHRASRPHNLNSPLIGAKCLLVCHHLLEEAAHANEVVHDSRRRRMRSRRSVLPFFGFVSVQSSGSVKPSQSTRDSSKAPMSSSISSG